MPPCRLLLQPGLVKAVSRSRTQTNETKKTVVIILLKAVSLQASLHMGLQPQQMLITATDLQKENLLIRPTVHAVRLSKKAQVKTIIAAARFGTVLCCLKGKRTASNLP